MQKRFLGRMAVVALVAMLVAALGGDGPARAATIEVTTTLDENDLDGVCSLREAITAANTDATTGDCPPGMGADLITFAVSGTIALNATLPPVTSVITIRGPGAATLTISGQGAVQVLLVENGGNLALTGVTVAEGRTDGDGAGINNQGTLAITNSTLSGNVAVRWGGGVYNAGSGTLMVTDSTLSNNQARFGGGIFNDGALTVTGSTLSGNRTINGGGAILHRVEISTATLSITDSTFTANTAFSVGGAIDFELSGLGRATVTIMTSTFTANTAFSDGGAIYSLGIGAIDISSSTFIGNQAGDFGGAIANHNDSRLAIANSTFSGNRAADGGAIENRSTLTLTNSTFSDNESVRGGVFLNTGTLTITNSTLSGNRADLSGGAIYNEGTVNSTNITLSGNESVQGGALFAFRGTTAITNSTFNGNSATGSPGSGGAIFNESATITLHNTVLGTDPGGNCVGAVADASGNLSADATCAFTQPSSRNSIDPGLDPAGLRDNGGPTPTIALLPGSPAIDAAMNCPPPATDQRGVARPQGAACDSGAYELEQVSVTLTGGKTCTRTSAAAAVCELALTINPPTSGTNSVTVTTDTGSFGAVTAAGSPATCSPGAVSATGPAAVTLMLPAGCSGVTLSETLLDLPVGAVAVTQTATLAGPDGATGAFTAILDSVPPTPSPSPTPPMEQILGFRQAAGLRLSCPPLASVRQIVTCTVVPVDAAGNAVATAPGVIEVSSLAGGLVTASGTRSTNLRIPCGGPMQTPPSPGTPIDPNTCRGVTFQLASTGVGVVEVRARYEPDSAPAAAGIDELETVETVTFVAG